MINVYLIKYSDLQEAKERILFEYSKVKGNTYTIEYLPNGAPRLVVNSITKGYVSISHTDGLLAMAFCDDKVGIDIERADRAISSKIAKSIEDWTRIEAYAKWIGKGLSKDILYGKISDDIISTIKWQEYVISVCSQCQSVEIIQLC
ncbi:MAG: hypothetical protein K2I46_03630 [Clostridia bacterium]|nr:hypothetical protein [Clostridia bacterium]